MPLLISWFRMVWIGACALGMVALTRLLLDLPAGPPGLDGFVFGATVFAYHFAHPEPTVRRAGWVAGGLAGVCYLFLPWTTQLAAAGPLLLWGLYYGLLRLPRWRGLRSRPVAKPLTVTLAWAWVTVLLPLPPERWAAALPLFTGRATFIFALALAYDLLDLDYDRHRGLATLAGQLGPPATLRLVNLALMVAAACVGVNFALHYYRLPATLAMVLSLALSAWVIRRLLGSGLTLEWQKVLVDGLMVMQFMSVGGLEGWSV
jgi:4-hydroxybenzoate polyprenyltransferase